MKYVRQENSICSFYVTDRIRSILTKNKTEKQLRDSLEEFEDEMIHNLGINALHNYYEGE